MPYELDTTIQTSETSTSTAQSVEDSAGILLETYTTENGFFSLLSNFDSVDDNGFYISLSPTFRILLTDSAVATVLESLSTQQMAVLQETYPYNYTGFDESNTEITLFASAYNGLTDPTTTVTAAESPYQIGFYYTVAYDSNEVSGLRDKFGYQAGSSVENQIDSAVQTIATEVLNSYMSKRQAFKRNKRIKMEPSSFSSLSVLPLSATGSAMTSQATTASPTTTGY